MSNESKWAFRVRCETEVQTVNFKTILRKGDGQASRSYNTFLFNLLWLIYDILFSNVWLNLTEKSAGKRPFLKLQIF